MSNRGSLSWPDSHAPCASFSSAILQRKVIHFKMKCDKSINLLIDKNMRKYFLWSIWQHRQTAMILSIFSQLISINLILSNFIRIVIHQRGDFVITIHLIYEKYSYMNGDFRPLVISTFILLLFSAGKNTSLQSTTNAARRFYVYCLAFLILVPLKPVQICFSQQLDDNLQGCNIHTRKGKEIKLQKI